MPKKAIIVRSKKSTTSVVDSIIKSFAESNNCFSLETKYTFTEGQSKDNISDPIPDIDNVYLIREGNKDRYKIGHADDPLKRMKTLNIGNSEVLSLVACCPGGVTV